MKSLGNIAYDAYGDNRGWKVYSGDAMPKWEDQTTGLKEAWEAAAKAVAEQIVKEGC